MRALLKKLYVVWLAYLLVSVLSAQAQAPDFEWAKRFGGADFDNCNALTTDATGNSYIAGAFYDNANFGGISLTSAGMADIMVIKCNPSGDVLWAKRAGGPDSDLASDVVTDAAGNVYITGTYKTTATFGSTTLTGGAYRNLFLAKYSANGDLSYAVGMGGVNGYFGTIQLAADGADNIYLLADFDGSVTFGSTTLASNGSSDVAVLKLNAAGALVWVTQLGGAYTDKARGIAVTEQGMVSVAGVFYSSTQMGSQTLASVSGADDIFVARLNESGNVLWARSAGGASMDYAHGIGIDAAGNTFVGGWFEGPATFGTINLSSGPNGGAYAAKYDVNGNLLWAISTIGPYQEIGTALTVDADGSSYLSGIFSGNITIGSLSLSATSLDLFVVKLSAAGQPVWALKGGANAVPYGIRTDNAGGLFLAGIFQNSITLGTTLLTSAGSYDIFLAKLSTITGLPETSTIPLSTYPSPFTTSLTVSLPGSGPATATLTDLLGREVYRQVIMAESGSATVTLTPPSTTLSGLYLLRLQQGDEVWQVKVLKE